MPIPQHPQPDFENAQFLREHARDILRFYDAHAFDANGGFFQYFLDDGRVYDADNRHLVSSARFVFNFAHAHLQHGDEKYRDWATHAFRYLQTHHRHANGHYVWTIGAEAITDARAMLYGQAFAMLAAAAATRVDVAGARECIDEMRQFMHAHFYEPAHHAFADERDESLTALSPYRGQNANMHSVEALLAAFDATSDARYLQRAEEVANQFCRVLPARDAAADGRIWEHYRPDWTHDWDYNRDAPDDLFKPWGFQPGHQMEWAKLLLQLDARAPHDWYLPTATALYDKAFAGGWDEQYGGLVYSHSPHGEFACADKYFWVQAEAIAAAWRLYCRSGEAKYREDYHRLWQWAWAHLVDHQYGAWFRVVSRGGEWLGPHKSPAGKVDYHTLGMCWDVLAGGGR